MTWTLVLSCASILAAFRPPSVLVHEAPLDGECPVTCVPTPGGDGDVLPGSGPHGTTFSIYFTTLIPGMGMGTEEECLPCPDSFCKQAISVNFNGYTTGWCFRYSLGPIGTSGPLPKFTRDGYLDTVCDTSVAFDWSVVDCATGATIWDQGQHTSTCACPGAGG